MGGKGRRPKEESNKVVEHTKSDGEGWGRGGGGGGGGEVSWFSVPECRPGSVYLT